MIVSTTIASWAAALRPLNAPNVASSSVYWLSEIRPARKSSAESTMLAVPAMATRAPTM